LTYSTTLDVIVLIFRCIPLQIRSMIGLLSELWHITMDETFLC